MDFLGEVTVDGDHRTCAIPGQGALDELIVTVDSDRHRLVYSIKESPFGFEHHSASMQALAEGETATRFVWTTDFKPDAVAPAIEETIDAAVESIKRQLQ